ncbi:prion-inhibition and propagation-domain-containing protein [Immersiella caudata]|uniref:Prion-inhibition and propagation-domain-containing protein n=1 Tax=Immersiella caudata TaxID=314043 RepID=A0AA39WJ85_9PEZI|nr:prion-inhibition and propagation-domain-containing protein [Immersiella caudata]
MAELAIAIVPLCLKLIFHSYQAFSEASELGKSSQKLFWRFKIQEARLRIWAKEWGLIDDHGNHQAGQLGRDVDDDKIVVETLVRVSDLFRDHEQLRARYGLTLASDTESHSAANTPSLATAIVDLATNPMAPSATYNALHGNAALATAAKKDAELRAALERMARPLAKLRWAVVDRTRFEAMITDLRDYNDGLYCLLSSVGRRRLRQALAPELIPGQKQADVVHTLGAASAEYADLASVAVLTAKRLQLEATTSTLGPLDAPDRLRIEGHRIEFDLQHTTPAVHQDRAIAFYTETPGAPRRVVLVEWKRYDKQLGEAIKQQQLSRLRGLAHLLNIDHKPPYLQVPYCLGFVADEWHPRIGFVFEYGGYTPPWSLQDVLISSAVPHVGDRFRLAHELCLSVCILHSAGWLHKGIRSENIIFSSPIPPHAGAADAAALQLDNPLFLGFEYARPDVLGAFSETIDNPSPQALLYRHPLCVDAGGRPRSRFEPAHDVYSLGVVLLEIGLWCSVEALWSKGKYTERLDSRFARHLCDHYAPQLGGKMGKIYMEAVTACLSGQYANGNDIGPEASTPTQERFYWAVVNPLSKLVA